MGLLAEFKRNGIIWPYHIIPHFRLWLNRPTLLAKHYCLIPKSAMALLSFTKYDTEKNKGVWEATFVHLAQALAKLANIVIQTLLFDS